MNDNFHAMPVYKFILFACVSTYIANSNTLLIIIQVGM